MKRLIRSILAASEVDIDVSMFADTPFKPDTDTSYYNNFLNAKDLAYMRKAKNRDGEIIMMSPNEYFKACADKIFKGRHSVEDLKHQREYSRFKNGESLIDNYTQAMKSGDKFPLCYLNYADSSQEGLHRMYAAGEAYGWDTKFPVLVITVFDQIWEDKVNLHREASQFEDYEFKDICEQAADNISNWRIAPPENLEFIYKDEIISVAKDAGYDIDVNVEIRDHEGHPQLQAKLYRYKDYEYEYNTSPYEVWIEDLYDMGQYNNISSVNTANPDDIDDIDIIDLFFE
jgi:hypothetical protein